MGAIDGFLMGVYAVVIPVSLTVKSMTMHA